MTRDVADVVVIGGGSAGTSIAWQLARRGAGRVVLVEKDGIAAGGTGWSSALIRQHYTHEVLARMALESLHVFERFDEVVGVDAGFQRCGFLVLVKPEDAAPLAANVAMHQSVGIESSVLTPDEVGELEPRIARDDIGAAAWEPGSGYADPVGATTGYAEAAKRNGADLRIGVTVERIVAGPSGVECVETDKGAIATRTVVVAAGYRTRGLVAPLGIDLPITPIRHDIAIVGRTVDFGPRHPIVSDRINGSYFRPEGADMTLIGTTAAHEGHVDPEVEQTREPYPDDTETLVMRFWRRFPTQENATLRKGYTGVYDCSPDLQPLLGPITEIPGLHVAVGFSGHGFKLSPVVGELIAERIVDGRTTLVDIDFFAPNRFAEGRPIGSTRAYSVGTLG
jgi:glycine/D-amino acid oxidase-like deaminating enzyme